MIRRRLETPVAVGIIVGAIALILVVLRLAVANDGDVSRFVVAGTQFTDPELVEPPIYVLENSAGYDGQFYWRLATSPTELDIAQHNGSQIDAPFRVGRIGYPMIAWALSFGQADWVKWSLVVTNVLGMGVIAMSGASLARTRGRPSVVGIMLASSSGLVMSLSRNLTEVTMIAALVAGVALMARRHYAWATLCWTVACLTHEQALFCVAPFALHRLFVMVRRREWGPRAPDAAWVVPMVAFGIWQLIGRSIFGEFPVSSVRGGLDFPFKGMFDQTKYWVTNGMGKYEALVVPQVALLATLVVVAFRSTKDLVEDDRWMRWALIGASVATVCLSDLIWGGPADLRQLVVLSTLAWLIIVTSGRRIPLVLVAATAAVLVATAAGRTARI